MVSIVIPSYNSERTIFDCLQSLKNQTYTGQYEIILVDSSIDRTPEIVRENFPDIQFVHFIQKTDPGTARNQGVRNASGDLILFIDSDCVAEKNWLEKLVILHETNPEVAAIGGAVLNANSSQNVVGWASYFSEFREFIPENPKSFVPHIPTLNISYKRWVFDKFGYFDARFYPQEDLVFNYQIHLNNYKILFDPDVKVFHTHRSNLKIFLEHQQKIGQITAQVLKILPLPGKQITRNKTLFLLVAPFLPFVKLIRTLVIFLRRNPALLLKNIRAVALMVVGLHGWIMGFTQGVFSQKLGSEL